MKKYWFAPGKIGGAWWGPISPISREGKVVGALLVAWLVGAGVLLPALSDLSAIMNAGIVLAGSIPFLVIAWAKTDRTRTWKDYEVSK